VTLQLNSTGVDVKRLKTILYDLWYAPGTINTTFDSTLDSAVRSFQSDWGLSVDGIVGTNTYNMLLQVHSFSSSSPRMLQSGKKGDDVAEMQARLRAYAAAVGNPLIAADGEFGTATTNSLKLFQAYSGLSQDGVCGNNTYNALRNTSFPGNFTV
jgi:peptidoglycan hydrolase-like protein with peptidoglycan-binding domain